MASQYHKTGEESPEKQIFAKGKYSIKVGQTRQNENLTCIMSRHIHIWNVKSICRKMTKKRPENEILAKGNNSCKSTSNATKVELDLYYVKTNTYTKFQVNISKDRREMFGNLIFCKGQYNSRKSRSNTTKVKLDLYYVKTNPYTKFQVNISKDDSEKFGKPSGPTPSRLTDRLTDRRWHRKPIVTPPPASSFQTNVPIFKEILSWECKQFINWNASVYQKNRAIEDYYIFRIW